MTLSTAQIAGLEANGVGGGQLRESGAQFFTIDLNLASYIQAYLAANPNAAGSSFTFMYNGQNVVNDLNTLASELPANGDIGTASSSVQAAFQTEVGLIGNLAMDHTAGCGLTVTITSPKKPPVGTPELGSGELLATGLLPIGAILLYRRRRNRRAS